MPLKESAVKEDGRRVSGSRGVPRTRICSGFRRLLGASAAFAVLIPAGCRQDMHNQPKYIPLRESSFFPDGRSARGQVEGTVARSQADADSYSQTGMQNGGEGDGFPFPITLQVLHRGQERFNIYCSPCHSRVGDGKGMLVQRGYSQAANFHSNRLKEAPAGHFFNVITNGYGAMPNYRRELPAVDRWAVVAYIRALQLSQDAREADGVSGARFAPLDETAANEGLSAALVSSDWGIRPGNSPPVVPMVGRPSSGQKEDNGPNATQPKTERREQKGSDQAGLGTKQAAAAASPGNATAGQKIYNDNCMMCHQQSRAGMPPMIPSLVGIVARTSGAHVRERVVNGVPTGNPPMPAFGSKLSAADIDNLIAFLKTKP